MILIYLLCILHLVLGEDQCCPSKEVTVGSSKVVYDFKEKRLDVADPGCKDGCVYTKDGEDYCFGSGGDSPVECKGQDEHNVLVVTGGDNPQRIASSAQISSMGVCVSPDTNIPNLPTATAGAKSVWIEASKTLMFCGGSDRFRGHEIQYPNGWGAMDTCLRLTPGQGHWDSDTAYNMKVNRSWFSLNNIKQTNEAVAAGGMSTGLGNISDSMEKYSGGGWHMMSNNLGHPIKLDTATYGHCAVQYDIGLNSFLMIIAGSTDPTDFAVATNAVTVYNLATGHSITRSSGALPALWAPACTKKDGDIFVSGGWHIKTASSKVYKGTITGGFIEIGDLGAPRSGHTMGVTSGTGRLYVAGGYNPDYAPYYLKEIETSDDGATWTTLPTKLTEGGEYAAMASVPAFTFKCH